MHLSTYRGLTKISCILDADLEKKLLTTRPGEWSPIPSCERRLQETGLALKKWLASRTESLHDVVLVGFPQNQLNPLEVVVTPLNQARFALLCIALVVCKSLYGLLYYTTALWCTKVHAMGIWSG